MSNVDKLKYNGVEYDLGKSIDASLTQSGQPADAKAVGEALNSKIDIIDGKGLSSNDYTTDEKTKLAGIENGANKTLIDTTLVNTGQAADAKSVGDAITSQNTNINAIKKRTDNVEDSITTLQNNKVDKTTPLINFDDTATDPLTDDGALANALTALGILSDVIPAGGGSLYLKKVLTELSNKFTTIQEETLTFSYGGKSVDILFRVSGNVLTVSMAKGNESMTLPTTWTNVGRLSSIRPSSNWFLSMVSSNGLTFTIRVWSDGGVSLIGHSSSNYWLQTNGTIIYK